MTPESNLASQPASTTPEVAPQGFLSRLIGAYFSPGETFQEVGRAPRPWVPILVMMVIAGLTSFALTHRIGYETIVRKQFEQIVNAGWITQAQADEQIQKATTGSAAVRGQLQGPIFAGLTMLVVMLIMAGLFKLFTMLMGSENTFKSLLGVTAYAFLAVGLIHVLLMLVVLYLKSPEEIDLLNPVGSNLGVVLPLVAPKLPKFILALASWVDLFGIWRIALLAIGYAAVSRKMKVSTAAVFVSVLYLIGALVFSAFASMFG